MINDDIHPANASLLPADEKHGHYMDKAYDYRKIYLGNVQDILPFLNKTGKGKLSETNRLFLY
jgi:hypothetical protein